MYKALCLTFAGLLVAAPWAPVRAAPDVVASIKPVHSLVAGVMDGVGTPKLLMTGGQSPHAYRLKPSEAAMLESAELVVWVGPALETVLARPVANIVGPDRSLPLIRTEGLRLLRTRAGGVWGTHSHGHHAHGHGKGDGPDDDHGHDAHDHSHDDDHDHDHDHDDDAHGHAHDDDDHDDDAHGHAHDDDDHAHDDGPGRVQGIPETAVDAHVWLDPDNAKTMVDAIAARLRALDPEHAATYAANAQAVKADIDSTDAAVRARVAPVRDVPFIVFHDAYQYLERHYDLNAVGAITLNPDRAPGARRVYEIRQRLTELGVRCVFREPQFAPDLVATIVENTEVRAGVLDPLGADLPPGPTAYTTLLRNLGRALHDCLADRD